MTDITIRKLYEAGAHFGHQTRYWSPKMSPYIYGKHNHIHIIDLDIALPLYKTAFRYIESEVAKGKMVLFVGTKRAALESTRTHAERCGSPYINHRWFGGTLTNFKTIRQSVRRYVDMDIDYNQDVHKNLDKKQQQKYLRELNTLRRNFEGIKDMSRLPDILFVVDIGYENIAVQEANKLNIPVVGVVDTNNSFDNIDYILPGNDDASMAVNIYLSAAADAVLRGKEKQGMDAGAGESGLPEEAPASEKKAQPQSKQESVSEAPLPAEAQTGSAGEAESTTSEAAAPVQSPDKLKKDGDS